MAVEYTAEPAPEPLKNAVGVLRERPLPRCRVLTRREAVPLGMANQRWYREVFSPSVPTGTGGFFTDRPAEEEEDYGTERLSPLRRAYGPYRP